MHEWWWMLLGLGAGTLAMAPVARGLQRRAEKRARDAERRARAAERLAELGSMTGGLAHEIKNPLSTVGLNAQLLAEGLRDAELPAEQRDRLLRRLDSLSREVERLRGILTDFLQFAGRIRLDPQPRDLVRLVDELCDFFHPQCDQAGVILRPQLPRAPITAPVDEGLIKQALMNLMINAVQALRDDRETASLEAAARPAPELILRVERSEDEARIHVIDTGPGVPLQRREAIFLPYVSHKSGGTGLGLPTARRIVEEHGGRLTLESAPGRGSDFTIHLPLRRETARGGGET